MKTALVTGFNARTSVRKRGKSTVTFSSLLVDALRDNGWEVDLKDIPLGHRIDSSYSVVFVGLASPLAASSSRAYTALGAIGKTWQQGRCVFFLDDPDTNKVMNGIDSLVRKPERLISPFFNTRQDYEIATQPQWNSWLMDCVEALRGGEWPTTLVPAHGWADVGELTARLRPEMRRNIQKVDLSAYVPKIEIPVVDRRRHWVTEERFDCPWVMRQRLGLPLKTLGKMDDQKRIREYTQAWGVLEDVVSPHGSGWFSPRLVHAIHARAIYCTEWKTMTRVGPAFEDFAYNIEGLSEVDREVLASDQRDQFLAASWKPTDVTKFFNEGIRL